METDEMNAQHISGTQARQIDRLQLAIFLSMPVLMWMTGCATTDTSRYTDPQNQLLEIRVKGKYGLIDRNGNVVIKPRYSKRISGWSEGWVWAIQPQRHWNSNSFDA